MALGGPPWKKPRRKRHLQTCQLCMCKYNSWSQHIKKQCLINQGRAVVAAKEGVLREQGYAPAQSAAVLLIHLPPEVRAAVGLRVVDCDIDDRGRVCGGRWWAGSWAVALAKVTAVKPEARKWLITRAALDPVFADHLRDVLLPAAEATQRLVGEPKAGAQVLEDAYRGRGKWVRLTPA